MADQDIALQVRTPPVDFNPVSSLEGAQTILGNQTKLQAAQSGLQMLNRQNAGEDIQFRNQLIANAAAHGFDSDSWNQQFRRAVAQGAPEAAQFIDHYSPITQQRVLAAYGAGPLQAVAAGGAGATSPLSAVAPTPTDQLDRMYQNMTPAQMAQSLQKNNVIVSALSTANDEPSYNRAIGRISANGIPYAAAIAGPYSSLRVLQLLSQAQARSAYLENRVAAAATGAPAPLVKNDVQNVGDVAYSIDPYRGTATALTPAKPEKIGTDLMGDIYGVRDPTAPGGFRRIDTDNLRAAGAPVSLQAAASRIQTAENATGNPAATNPRSTAAGNGQFIDSTWLSTFKAERPELAKSLSDQQILALRTDPVLGPALNLQMTGAYARSNAAELTKAGIPVTTASLLLSHRFGADAAKIYAAPPNTPIAQVVSAKVMDANPDLKGQTTGTYIQRVIRQVGNDPVAAGGTAGQKFDPALLPPGTDLKTGIDPKTGRNEGFLLTRPVNERGLIKGLANYDIDPTAIGYRQKAGVQAALATYDPTYRSDIFPVVKATEEAFSHGKQGDQVRFFNNSIQHMTTLQNYATAMQNGDTRALNALKNTVQTQLGFAAPNTFNALKDVVGQEIVKSIVPTGGGEIERQEVAKKLSAASSPAQLASLLEGYKELGGAQLRDLKIQYENGTFHKRNDFDDKLIPESRAELARIEKGTTAPSISAAATPPVPGAKLYQGQWYTRGPNGEAVPVKP